MANPTNMSEKGLPGDFEPNNFLNSLLLVSKGVLLSPGFFYRGMKRQGGLGTPFFFLASCVLVHTLIVGLLFKNHSIIATNLLFGLVFPFITAGILYYIMTQLFKAPGTYEVAFRVNAYAAAVALVSWIPLIGIILEFYRLYLIGVGLCQTFEIKPSRAFLAIVLTIFVYMVASLAIHQVTGGLWPSAPN
jgi:hypothetical protein